MLENVYEGLNARSEVYLSKEYFCEMYPTCVSSKLCDLFLPESATIYILVLNCTGQTHGPTDTWTHGPMDTKF